MALISNRKILIASTVGNIIEFYDFTLYGFFTPLIAQLFFPSSDPRTAILSTLAIFAAGFLMRPLGGIIFGHIGDRFGRKIALSASILLMSFATALMGLLPSYEMVGIWASISLMVCRLLQGISAGGEYNGAFILLIEHGNKQKIGVIGSFIVSSCALGALLAVFLGSIALKEDMPAWAWRVPFILGSLVGFLGLYIRLKINESPEFLAYLHKQPPLKFPLIYAFKENKRAFLRTIGVTTLSLTLINVLVVYINVYLNKTLLIPLRDVLQLNTFALLVFVITAPIAGILSDKIGHIRLIKILTIISMISTYPVFLLLNTQEFYFILCGEILLSIVTASLAGISNAFMYTEFPIAFRYSGSAFSNGIGSAIGGMAPFIASWLIFTTGNILMPPLYIVVCALITFGILSKFKTSVLS